MINLNKRKLLKLRLKTEEKILMIYKVLINQYTFILVYGITRLIVVSNTNLKFYTRDSNEFGEKQMEFKYLYFIVIFYSLYLFLIICGIFLKKKNKGSFSGEKSNIFFSFITIFAHLFIIIWKYKFI